MKESVWGATLGLGIGLLVFVIIFTVVIKKNHNEFKTIIQEVNSRIEQVEIDIRVLKGASHEEIELDTARKLFNGPIRDPFTRLK
jgi:uncharacterized protein YoxC